jgi:integrase/recombinase XerD
MLLCSRASRSYTPEGLSNAVRGVMVRSGIWAKAPRVPRVHDFRHAFAVAALRRWYEEGRDVQSELPKLSMYMGHVSIASTTYYLRFMPAVVTLASERFASVCGALVQEENP